MYSDYNSENLIFRIRVSNVIKQTAKNPVSNTVFDVKDQLFMIKNFQEGLMSTIIKGVDHLTKVLLRKVKDMTVSEDGMYTQQPVWVLDTVGTNLLAVLGLDYIDKTRTVSNDIVEVYHTLGIEAARQTIYNELVEVIEFDGTYINAHHYSLLCDRMTYSSQMISVSRSGLHNDDIGPIAKASFEETPKMFLNAARFGEIDNMRGVSANVMCGQEGYYGTSSFHVMLDMNMYIGLSTKLETKSSEDVNISTYDNTTVDDTLDTYCNLSNIIIHNSNRNITPIQINTNAVQLDF